MPRFTVARFEDFSVLKVEGGLHCLRVPSSRSKGAACAGTGGMPYPVDYLNWSELIDTLRVELQSKSRIFVCALDMYPSELLHDARHGAEFEHIDIGLVRESRTRRLLRFFLEAGFSASVTVVQEGTEVSKDGYEFWISVTSKFRANEGATYWVSELTGPLDSLRDREPLPV